jgi:hypothetical protein
MNYFNRNELFKLIASAPLEIPRWFEYEDDTYKKLKVFEKENEIELMKTDANKEIKDEQRTRRLEWEKRKYLIWRIYYAKEMLKLIKTEADLLE